MKKHMNILQKGHHVHMAELGRAGPGVDRM